ncbi:MAG: hypothetical protein HUU60_11655 [Armatimonadetes bacterium]|nr:hypothetical protein [Armatimonadota bacterium]
MFRLPLLIVALLVSVAGLASGRPLPGVKCDQPPIIDGSPDDECWRTAAQAEDFFDPFTGNLAQPQTIAKITYDEKAIYIHFQCLDDQPDGIVAREIRPNASFDGEDWVGIWIDPLYTRQWDNISTFKVNALGTTSENIAGGAAAKREWRGQWQAAAIRTETGWSAELAIPWAIVLRGSGPSPRNMGINFIRRHHRSKAVFHWSNLTSQHKPEYMGIWQNVEPPRVASRATTQLMAYFAPELRQKGGTESAPAGLDVKHSLQNGLIGMVTLNPDFRNIEGQIEGIQFSRSERFVDDVRPFFEEGEDYLDLTDEHAIGRMFYSQRIRDFDAGGKAFGRIGRDFSIGSLVTFGQGKEDNAVVNLGLSFGQHGNANVYLTRHGSTEAENSGFRIERNQGNYIAAAEVSRLAINGVRTEASSYGLAYAIPKLFAVARATSIDKGFRPPLGLIEFDDKKGSYLFAEYEDEFRQSWTTRQTASLYAAKYRRMDGSPFTETISIDGSIIVRSDERWSAGFSLTTFEGARDRIGSFGYTNRSSDRTRRWSVFVSTGKRDDKPSTFVSASFNRRLFGRVDANYSGSVLSLAGRTEQHILTLGWEIDSKRAITGRAVYRDGDYNFYLAYRSSGFAGQETYLIIGDPNARRFESRISLKLVWAI